MKTENLEELQAVLKGENFVVAGVSHYATLISKVKKIQQFKDLSADAIAHILTEMAIKKDLFIVKDERILSVNIKSCNFSSRVENVLKACGVETIGDIVKSPKSVLASYRNSGNKTIGELEQFCLKSFEEVMSDCFIVEDEKLLAMNIEDCNFSRTLYDYIDGRAKTVGDLVVYSKTVMKRWAPEFMTKNGLSELEDFFEKHGVVVSH